MLRAKDVADPRQRLICRFVAGKEEFDEEASLLQALPMDVLMPGALIPRAFLTKLIKVIKVIFGLLKYSLLDISFIDGYERCSHSVKHVLSCLRKCS